MRAKEIKKLIDLVEQSNIAELEVNRWGKKVRIRKYANSSTMQSNQQDAIIVSQNPVQAALSPPTTGTVPSEPVPARVDSNIYEIRSPMVGTFYRSPAPDADPYVEVGKAVSRGQVLCIIEAMKLMNEIEAEGPGRVVETLVENGQPVEYDQVLFKMEKV